jgi:hypothetical protein
MMTAAIATVLFTEQGGITKFLITNYGNNKIAPSSSESVRQEGDYHRKYRAGGVEQWRVEVERRDACLH